MEMQLAQLKDFHAKFDPTWADTPVLASNDVRTLRVRLMTEELAETIEAMEKGSISDVAKELADLLYTVYGTIGVYGLAEKMPAVFTANHESQMSKDAPSGNAQKAIKGESYQEADITSILNT